MINVEVTRNANETTASLVRRFTKRVQGSGVLPRVRSLRSASRKLTKFARKKATLKRIGLREERAILEKLGKLEVPEKRFGSR